ncbi:Crp/Fnr family transcriptional regulator [Flavobacteriaceae bacterium TP-CH-4]|uniref:Crp/Fnr family transcriptional regulator n=1 Tax=Pelagihabitans pacificus TaxID=2696054 RepID=A0A967AWK8_9FLAO|nr:Crp/Fnr family transcriptional regulator [Pelagihabitans pacificus]NHF58917.1 Crp/Fnr family transcriptional regulator [Pelagihabitans pacificus]
MSETELQRLLGFFSDVQIDSEQADHFRKLWTMRAFERSELITEAGHTERYFYFVLEGVQALYVLNQRGEKVVLGFSYSGSPSGVFDSFIARSPSSTFLEALKPSKLLAITLPDYESLFGLFPDFHRWGHLFFREVLFGRLFREVELLTLSAEQRYIAFMQRCPEELKVIPQKYLASYLNMKPETFSRLRSSTSY